MKTRINTNTRIILLSGIISFFLLVYILIQVNTNLEQAINIERSKTEISDYIIGLGHLFILVFSLYAVVFIFSHFGKLKDLGWLRIIVLILGIVSVFSFGIEKVMIDEIARQFRSGMEIKELGILNIAYIINLTFSLLMFFFIIKTLPLLKTPYIS
jgi:uncharacterized membrane protein